MEKTREVDAAAEHLPAGAHGDGQTLAGEGGGVQRGGTLLHHAVDRHLFTGLHHDDGTHRHLVGVYSRQFAVFLNIGIVGADVHEGGDIAAALAYGVALEQLAHLIEQHYRHALAVLPQGDGPDGGHGHKKVFVKHAAVSDALECLAENIVPHQQIGHQKQQ